MGMRLPLASRHAEKSPANISGVGMVAVLGAAAVLFRYASNDVKKNVRLRPLYSHGTMIGPPNTPPKSCCSSGGLGRPSALLKKLIESSASCRKNSNAFPCHLFDPDRDTKLTAPPPAWPNSALNPFVSTANSVMASTEGELSVVHNRCSNGAPGVADTPSTLRSQPPSCPPPITMLPRPPSPPVPVLASGAMRLRSSGERSCPPTTSGRYSMNLQLIAVATFTLSV